MTISPLLTRVGRCCSNLNNAVSLYNQITFRHPIQSMPDCLLPRLYPGTGDGDVRIVGMVGNFQNVAAFVEPMFLDAMRMNDFFLHGCNQAGSIAGALYYQWLGRELCRCRFYSNSSFNCLSESVIASIWVASRRLRRCLRWAMCFGKVFSKSAAPVSVSVTRILRRSFGENWRCTRPRCSSRSTTPVRVPLVIRVLAPMSLKLMGGRLPQGEKHISLRCRQTQCP